MTLAVTSFVPTTGPVTGGTKVVITGTGLDTVSNVQFGTLEAAIDTTATNTATSLTVIAPGGAEAGTVKIAAVDYTDGTIAESSGNYTYTAVTSPNLTSVAATVWIVKVDSSEAQDGSAYIPVRGITDCQPTLDTTTQDDSDYDSGEWGSDAKTMLKWGLTLKLSRKRAAAYVEDPGQALLRAASDQVGSPGIVRVEWYDRNGHGSEAYEGFAMVEWSYDGGAPGALLTASVTLMGQGTRTVIDNPVS